MSSQTSAKRSALVNFVMATIDSMQDNYNKQATHGHYPLSDDPDTRSLVRKEISEKPFDPSHWDYVVSNYDLFGISFKPWRKFITAMTQLVKSDLTAEANPSYAGSMDTTS